MSIFRFHFGFAYIESRFKTLRLLILLIVTVIYIGLGHNATAQTCDESQIRASAKQLLGRIGDLSEIRKVAFDSDEKATEEGYPPTRIWTVHSGQYRLCYFENGHLFSILNMTMFMQRAKALRVGESIVKTVDNAKTRALQWAEMAGLPCKNLVLENSITYGNRNGLRGNPLNDRTISLYLYEEPYGYKVEGSAVGIHVTLDCESGLPMMVEVEDETTYEPPDVQITAETAVNKVIEFVGKKSMTGNERARDALQKLDRTQLTKSANLVFSVGYGEDADPEGSVPNEHKHVRLCFKMRTADLTAYVDSKTGVVKGVTYGDPTGMFKTNASQSRTPKGNESLLHSSEATKSGKPLTANRVMVNWFLMLASIVITFCLAGLLWQKVVRPTKGFGS